MDLDKHFQRSSYRSTRNPYCIVLHKFHLECDQIFTQVLKLDKETLIKQTMEKLFMKQNNPKIIIYQQYVRKNM